MKRYCFNILLIILTCSCSRFFLQPEKSIPSQGYSLYYSLLHVSSRPNLTSQTKPFLGVSFVSRHLEQEIPPCKNSVFIQITDVINGTPAMEAGLKKDDIILSLNNEPICQDGGDIEILFKKVIEKQKIGSTVNMGILRGNERISVDAKLVEVPTYHHHEAEHRYLDGCPECPPSLLEKTLLTQNASTLFSEVLSGLNQRSNSIQNLNWLYKRESNPFQLKEFTYMIRHPLSAGAVAKEWSDRLISKTHKENWQMEDIIQESAHLLDIDLKPSLMATEITFPELIKTMEVTKERIEQSLNSLTPEEKSLLKEKALEPWNDDQWNSLLGLFLKIDRKELFDAFSPLLSFLTRDNLSLLKEDLIRRFGNNKGPILFESMTSIGKVIVGGSGPNIYQEDAALILDLGGDDIYLNNAGGTRSGMPVAMVIDWDGDDLYLNKENFSQGSGVLGGGILLDLSGNDTFDALDGSQGTGLFGIGLLYHGGGHSVYKARKFSQGVGQIGVGLIWNGDGDTLYSCSEEGQGLGLFGGAGILIDRAGNDYYQLGGLQPDFRDPSRATVSMGQGFGKGLRPENGKDGVSGGIGILIDEDGDDMYTADYFAQGASYYYGVGILNDISGNDQYISGRYAQGAGVHSSVGVLIDQKGDDFYFASYGVGQGVGHDFGVGYLEDREGDDRYLGGILVQGAATTGGIGILFDMYGKDNYMCTDKGQPFAQDEGCIGVLIDTEPSLDLMNKHNQAEFIRLGFKKSF
jgi:hypothetical protein